MVASAARSPLGRARRLQGFIAWGVEGVVEEIFADTIGGITVSQGVVRLDLVSQSATRTDRQGRPELVFRQRVLIPVDGFLKAAEGLRQVAEQLEKAAASQGASADSGAQPAVGETAQPARPAARSPNFE